MHHLLGHHKQQFIILKSMEFTEQEQHIQGVLEKTSRATMHAHSCRTEFQDVGDLLRETPKPL
jgi:hypothetical protein